MIRHPTRGHKNNSRKPGSHRHTVGNETASPERCWKLQGKKVEELKRLRGNVFPHHSSFLKGKIKSGVWYNHQRISAKKKKGPEVASLLSEPLNNLKIIVFIDPETRKTWKERRRICASFNNPNSTKGNEQDSDKIAPPE